jgi:membrane associated rhomboid family serine protease
MVLGIALYMSGALSLFAAVLLLLRSPRNNLVHLVQLTALAAVSFFLYFTRRFDPVFVALVVTAVTALVVMPSVLAALTRRSAAKGSFRLARALVLARWVLTFSAVARVQAGILRALLEDDEGDTSGALGRLGRLRKGNRPGGLASQVDASALTLAIRRGRIDDGLAYLEEAGNPADLARTSPDVGLMALRILGEAGNLAGAAAVLRSLAELGPEKLPPRVLLAAYASFLRAAGDDVRLAEIIGTARSHGWMTLAEETAIRKPLEPSQDWAGWDIPWPPPVRIPAASKRWTFRSPPLSRAPVTAVLLGVNFLFMLGLAVAGREKDLASLAAWGANVSFLVREGEVWRLGSSIFLHFGALHFTLNMLALYVLGRMGENLYGSARFFMVFVLSGLAGSLMSSLVTNPPMSAGASGAISGIIGMVLAFVLLWGKRISTSFRNRYLAVFLFVVAADMVFGFSEEVIDNMAHLGGLLGGFVLTMALRPNPARAEGVSPLRKTLAGAGVALSAAAIGGCLLMALDNGIRGGVLPDTIPFLRRGFHEAGVALDVPAHWNAEKFEGRTNYVGGLGITLYAPDELGPDAATPPGTEELKAHVTREFPEDRVEMAFVRPGTSAGVERGRVGVRVGEGGKEAFFLFCFAAAEGRLYRIVFSLPERNLRVFEKLVDRTVRSLRGGWGSEEAVAAGYFPFSSPAFPSSILRKAAFRKRICSARMRFCSSRISRYRATAPSTRLFMSATDASVCARRLFAASSAPAAFSSTFWILRSASNTREMLPFTARWSVLRERRETSAAPRFLSASAMRASSREMRSAKSASSPVF